MVPIIFRSNFRSFLVVAAVLVGFGSVNGPEIERRFFPVVSGVEITRIEPAPVLSARIWGRFQRVRDCSFEGLTWYLGDRDRRATVRLVFEEASKVRPQGVSEFGPWKVHLTPEQFTENSYAIALHRCHPFWLSRTEFYP